ncbi:hypothetical protein [uncultured Brevundimonas sp.]|uniref:hypothetical protein n=1 Tax=uncultured Brevundimonas sp. TaxID=213418 RepID=UPI0025E359D9|nr:hypothetical protein [uncultured Brevundimonas sp.]
MDRPNEDWFPVLQGFYLETQRAFLSAWDQLSAGEHSKIFWGPRPELWKVIGDEILFTKELTDHRQLQSTIHCWIEAIETTRQFLRKFERPLDVKCTAWTAGFPVVNKEVALPKEVDLQGPPVTNYVKEAGRLLEERYSARPKSKKGKIEVDYIGPSIDIGFRLSQFATNRKFMISVGAAYILTLSNKKNPAIKLRSIRYDGSAVLKGVFGGANYPLFWLDMSKDGDLSRLEDRLTPQTNCSLEDIHAFCSQFFEEARAYTFPPFIISETETEILEKPELWDAAIEQFKQRLVSEVIGDDASQKEAEEEMPPATIEVLSEKPKPVTPKKPISDETPKAVSTIDFARLVNRVYKLTTDMEDSMKKTDDEAK